MAGEPRVYKGLVITREEAEDILKRDLRRFERAVLSSVKVSLNENQFAALVSFCFNVGEGNFRKSSVLRAVNAKQFHLVPARLMLWNKAAGKVMRGLTRRRAEEGELFIKPVSGGAEWAEPVASAHVKPEPGEGKPISQSTTAGAAIALGGAGGVQATAEAVKQAGEAAEAGKGIVEFATAVGPWVLLALAIAGFAAYIIWERKRRSREEGV
jgi:lysozyme